MANWQIVRPSFTMKIVGDNGIEITTPRGIVGQWSGDEVLRLHDALGWAIAEMNQTSRRREKGEEATMNLIRPDRRTERAGR